AESTKVNGGHRGAGGGRLLCLQLHVRADSDPQRAVEQRYQWRDKTLHGRLSIPTLSAVLDLVLSANQNPQLLAARGNRQVGLMLEPRPSDTNSILRAPPPPALPAHHPSPSVHFGRYRTLCRGRRTREAPGAASHGTRSCSTRPFHFRDDPTSQLLLTTISLFPVISSPVPPTPPQPSNTNPILQAPPPSCPPTASLRACMLDIIALYAVAIAPEKHLVLPVESWHKKLLNQTLSLAIAPEKHLVLPVESWHKKLLNQTDLVSLAHDPTRQLAVLPWPFANDWIFLSLSYELVEWMGCLIPPFIPLLSPRVIPSLLSPRVIPSLLSPRGIPSLLSPRVIPSLLSPRGIPSRSPLSPQDPLNEYAMFVEAVGVDGLFSDFPATALKYLRKYFF
ncbi:unnamed protein product, partial [Closterium sp. Yama58-4]